MFQFGNMDLLRERFTVAFQGLSGSQFQSRARFPDGPTHQAIQP